MRKVSIVRLGCLDLKKWIFKRLLLKETLDIEVGHLQQFDGLLQLWRHDKRLLLLYAQ
jgi:hypothetical protein